MSIGLNMVRVKQGSDQRRTNIQGRKKSILLPCI
jgi:hypothetical protein